MLAWYNSPSQMLITSHLIATFLAIREKMAKSRVGGRVYGYQFRTHDGAGFFRFDRINIDGGGGWYMDHRGAQSRVSVNFRAIRVYPVFWYVFRCPEVWGWWWGSLGGR